MPTKIEWTEETWNPVTGCTKVSSGCEHCYAERMAKRFAGRFGYPKDDPFRVTVHHDKLEQPLRWRKPRKVFVCSMGDLFHEDVPWGTIAQIWRVMELCPQHQFQVLTKRPMRMQTLTPYLPMDNGAPPNIWLGVTAENQEMADERIPILLDTPAAVRFVSIEPMLGPVDLEATPGWLCPISKTTSRLNWVIVGGETGPGARPMHPDWGRAVRDQCTEAGAPFFFKQWGEWSADPELAVSRRRRAGIAHDHGTTGGSSYIIIDADGAEHSTDELNEFRLPTGWRQMYRVGKKRAGRLLDGREHSETPND